MENKTIGERMKSANIGVNDLKINVAYDDYGISKLDLQSALEKIEKYKLGVFEVDSIFGKKRRQISPLIAYVCEHEDKVQDAPKFGAKTESREFVPTYYSHAFIAQWAENKGLNEEDFEDIMTAFENDRFPAAKVKLSRKPVNIKTLSGKYICF